MLHGLLCMCYVVLFAAVHLCGHKTKNKYHTHYNMCSVCQHTTLTMSKDDTHYDAPTLTMRKDGANYDTATLTMRKDGANYDAWYATIKQHIAHST